MSSRKESEGKSRQGSGRELAQHLPRQSARLDPDRAAFVREAAPVHPDAMHAPRIGAQPRRIAGQIEQPLFGADPHRVRIEQEQIRALARLECAAIAYDRTSTRLNSSHECAYRM